MQLSTPSLHELFITIIEERLNENNPHLSQYKEVYNVSINNRIDNGWIVEADGQEYKITAMDVLEELL
jgi:hypothetical protein